MERIQANSSVIVVVDVQERLAQAMPKERMADLERGAGILLEAARLLGAEVIATEQYPKGLGPTLSSLDAKLAEIGAKKIEKMAFSALDEPAFSQALSANTPRAAIVLGMETHVCVFQTVRDLTKRGLEVYVPVDAVASRRDDHREVGLSLCERAGAVRTTTESVVFDWLKQAGSDEFRALSKLIR